MKGFTNLPPSESATTLLQFGEHYLDSDDGGVPWDKFPEALKSAELARIPSIPATQSLEFPLH